MNLVKMTANKDKDVDFVAFIILERLPKILFILVLCKFNFYFKIT